MAVDPGIRHAHPDPVAMAGPAAAIYHDQPAADDVAAAVAGGHAGRTWYCRNKDAQRIWVDDKAPPVETVIGFIEPYRDPLGVRSEFEGIVGIPDADKTRVLRELSNMADKFVCRLPWVNGDSNNKGPFEKETFEAPDFASIQSKGASIFFRELFG